MKKTKSVYKKELLAANKGHAKELFEKYLYFRKITRSMAELEIVEPLSYAEDLLIFKFYKIEKSLKDEDLLDSKYYAAGKAVAKIHKRVNSDSQNRDSFVLGDLWPGNLAFLEGKILFFDLESPNTCANFYNYYKNSSYLDIAVFVYQTFFNELHLHPSLLEFFRRLKYATFFLRAYERNYINPLFHLDFYQYLFLEHKRLLCNIFKRQNIFKEIFYMTVLSLLFIFYILLLWLMFLLFEICSKIKNLKKK